MLSERERRNIGDALEQGGLPALCRALSSHDQARLAKWLTFKFRRCLGCGYPFALTETAIKRCAPCRKAYARETELKFYKEHRDELVERQRRSRRANPEKARAHEKAWREKNKDKVSEKARRWRIANKDRYNANIRKWQHNWRQENPELSRQKGRDDYTRKIGKLRASGELEDFRAEQRNRRRLWREANSKGIARRRREIDQARRLPPGSTQWPHITNALTSGHSLLLTINAVLPWGLPGHIRDDAGQDIAVAICAGEMKIETLLNDPDSIARPFITAAKKKNYEANGYAISLDEPRRDGRSWHDVLESSTE